MWGTMLVIMLAIDDIDFSILTKRAELKLYSDIKILFVGLSYLFERRAENGPILENQYN